MNVTVIGAGLAGSECAWQLAQRGISVTLREMKPEKKTPAHVTNDFAELCCSNSLRSAPLWLKTPSRIIFIPFSCAASKRRLKSSSVPRSSSTFK